MFRLINNHLQAYSRPEDDYLLVETCSLHITLCNKNSCADVQISITITDLGCLTTKYCGKHL